MSAGKTYEEYCQAYGVRPDPLLVRIHADGHTVLEQISRADGINVYRVQVNDGLFSVANLADYERIPAMRVEPEPVQLSLFGEMA